MTRRGRGWRLGGGLAALMAIAVATTGCIVQGFGPIEVNGWKFPPMFPVASGTRMLPLDVADLPKKIPEDATFACATALLGQVRLDYDADELTAPISFVRLPEEAPVRLLWQPGVSARETDDGAVVIGPDAKVLAAEGQPSLELSGEFVDGDDRFHVCFVDYLPEPPDEPTPTPFQ